MGSLLPRAIIECARKFGRVVLSVLVPAGGALFAANGLSVETAEAKTPGKTYCFYSKCHRVKTIAETERLIGETQVVHASHYDSCKRDRYNPCGLTSSGAVFNSEAPDNAASPILPDGTTVLVRSPETGVSLVLRIDNAGPYWGNRTLDVSRKAAEVLGFAGQGVAKLEMRVIDAPTVAEATYKKRRVYDPVPGYVGEFASLDDAEQGAGRAYMVAGLESPIAVLGAGNPTQLAGSVGTQSGAAVVVPTVLAALKPAPDVMPLAKPAEPIKVASLETTAVVDVKPAAKPSQARSVVERTSPRNSRSYRVAQRERQQQAARKTTASVQKREGIPKFVTQDGTNDMSVFSRHVHAGGERIAPQERRQRIAGLGRSG